MLTFLATATLAQGFGPPAGEPWARHAIDSSSRGADGIRVADINGDGLWDLTTGWEEGGRVSVYINPGFKKARNNWPKVIVGSVKSPEDAVFVDLNSDGRLDVASSTEGKERTVYAHIAPPPSVSLSLESEWKTLLFPATEKRNQWTNLLAAGPSTRFRARVLAIEKAVRRRMDYVIKTQRYGQ